MRIDEGLLEELIRYYRQYRSRSKKFQFMQECWERYRKLAFPMRSNSERLAEKILQRNAWDIYAVTGKGPFALRWEIYELEDGGYALVVTE